MRYMLVTELARDISSAKLSGIGIEVPPMRLAPQSFLGINRIGAGCSAAALVVFRNVTGLFPSRL